MIKIIEAKPILNLYWLLIPHFKECNFYVTVSLDKINYFRFSVQIKK